MRRRVVIAAEANNDLGEILAFVAQDSPRAAVRLVAQLADAAEGLALSALHYPVVLARRDMLIRRRVVGSYNMLFEVADDAVRVARIVHGSRDLTRLFPET